MWWVSSHRFQVVRGKIGGSSYMTYDEVWAVDAVRIRTFFNGQNDDVTVIPLPDKTVGPMTIPQTRIIITGVNAEELYRRFYLSFMTAGG